jgi:hypothetical protein
MPFVEGESLRARLEREKQLPIADAVRIATEVAGALEEAAQVEPNDRLVFRNQDAHGT